MTKHTTYEFPSGNLPEIQMTELEEKYLGREKCPPQWPWGIISFALGLTFYHFVILN